MIRFVALTTSLLITILLTACASQPPELQTENLLPDDWQNTSTAQNNVSIATDDWWAKFDNAELNQLIEQAMQTNFDLLASFQRIEQARARLSANRSRLFPHLDASYSANTNSQWEDGEDRRRSDGDRAGINASYEVDLWGQVRADATAAEAALAGSSFNHQTVALSLQAQLASSYFQYLAAKDRLRFAEESLVNSEQLLRLVELQFNEGSASRLELVQQQSSVIGQRAQINSLRNSLQQVSYALDVLLGQKPGTLELTGQSLDEIHLPEIAAGQPADLLQRRPDILQAEAALAAAHANVEVARAAFYPNLRITAGANASQLFIGNPVTQAASLAADLAAPVFDAGRNRSELQRSLAAQQEALLNYYQTLLTAVAEVQGSLVNVTQLSNNNELQAQRLALANESHALAELRYKEGSADFITLLDAERSLIAAQDVYVQARLERHLEAVTLYRALGGSWYTH